MKIRQPGFISQFDYSKRPFSVRTLPELYRGEICDYPNLDLFLRCPKLYGSWDLRTVSWGQAFSDPENGSVTMPKPWKYDANNTLIEKGAILVIGFERAVDSNPIVITSVLPTDSNAFFANIIQAQTSRQRTFPFKELYKDQNIRYRRKNETREVTIQEDGDGAVNINLTGGDETYNIQVRGTTVLKIQNGEVNIGGNATEPIPLGNTLATILSNIVALFGTIKYQVSGSSTTGPDPASVTAITNLAATINNILSTQGKVK